MLFSVLCASICVLSRLPFLVQSGGSAFGVQAVVLFAPGTAAFVVYVSLLYAPGDIVSGILYIFRLAAIALNVRLSPLYEFHDRPSCSRVPVPCESLDRVFSFRVFALCESLVVFKILLINMGSVISFSTCFTSRIKAVFRGSVSAKEINGCRKGESAFGALFLRYTVLHGRSTFLSSRLRLLQ